MAEGKTKQAQAEKARVNINDEEDLKYWADKFGVAQIRIKDAVASVGTLATKVEQYLQK